MITQAPAAVYENRISGISSQLNILKKKKDLIAWARFACIVILIAFGYYLWPWGLFYASLPAVLLFAVFLRLVVLSARNNERISNLEFLLFINHQEIDIANGKYVHLPDGKEYLPSLHEYAQDLDIFGRASIYQYINRTTSEQGHQRLSAWLLNAADSDSISQRQEASRELAPLYEWRQQFQAYGLADKITMSTQQRIVTWLKAPNRFLKPKWKLIRFLFPAIILTALALYIFNILPSPVFYGLVFIFFIVSILVQKNVTPVHTQLNKIVGEIQTLSNTINWIEQQQFSSAFLKTLQQHFLTNVSPASIQVNALKKILDRLDYLLNMVVAIPLNTFLLWNLQQVMALENWKEKNKNHVLNWFNALGEMEAISSISAIQFNHPAWCYPVLSREEGVFEGVEIGHPLIFENKRVCSSFATSGMGKVALVTGSNMAGKSTFLRSVGVNLVLAMTGAPVCAISLAVSPMRVISSMRVADNLEESTSTFYAELKKLKYIIEAVNRREKIFILLDEILRGTNSLDRHTGSKALINQLIRHNAVAMLATHDLELASMVKAYPDNIYNYHFDVQVDNDELYFDYKLKEGVCQSMNASILMKQIGIEL